MSLRDVTERFLVLYLPRWLCPISVPRYDCDIVARALVQGKRKLHGMS
jgi:hypothetical protein